MSTYYSEAHPIKGGLQSVYDQFMVRNSVMVGQKSNLKRDF